MKHDRTHGPGMKTCEPNGGKVAEDIESEIRMRWANIVRFAQVNQSDAFDDVFFLLFQLDRERKARKDAEQAVTQSQRILEAEIARREAEAVTRLEKLPTWR